MKRVPNASSGPKGAKMLSPLLIAAPLGLLSLKNRASLPLFLSDLFFIVAVAYVAVGLFQFVCNLGLFTSVQFGFSRLRNAFRKTADSTPATGDYFSYAQSRTKYQCYTRFLLVGLVMFFASVVANVAFK